MEEIQGAKVKHLTQTSGNQARPSRVSDIYSVTRKISDSQPGKGGLGRGFQAEKTECVTAQK